MEASDDKESVAKKKSPLGKLASLAVVAGIAYVAKRLLRAKQAQDRDTPKDVPKK